MIHECSRSIGKESLLFLSVLIKRNALVGHWNELTRLSYTMATYLMLARVSLCFITNLKLGGARAKSFTGWPFRKQLQAIIITALLE